MKRRYEIRIILITSCVLLSPLLGACKDGDDLSISYLEQQLANTDLNTSSAYIHNNPLPEGRNRLRVLAIGNSYTVDALYYTNQILAGAGIDNTTYSVYYLHYSGATLEHWWNVAAQEDSLEMSFCAGQRMPVETGTLKDLLAQDWDVITFQQYSGYSINYKTFNPWLRQLIDFVKQNCPNKEVTFAWQMAWSYNDIVEPSMSSYNRWLLIGLAIKQMIVSDGIDLIIPVGTAIQNARNTSLNGESQLTCDGKHLDIGIGRYIAACTWLQTIFAPVYSFSVLGNGAIPPMGECPPQRFVSEPVTKENSLIAQQCAVNAVLQPFLITVESPTSDQ